MDSDTPNQITQLLDRHGAPLVLYARQWCDSPEDIVQQALIRLWEQPTAPERPVAWLYRVVRNLAIDWSRAQRRRWDHESSAAHSRQASRAAWFHASSDSGLEATQVTTALATLPIDQREVIVARLWSGLTFAEIAELTETSTSTAHRRYAEGLASLRARLLSIEEIDLSELSR